MPIKPSEQRGLKLRADLINRTSRYERQVKALYDGALNDISKLLSTVEYDPSTPFSFEDVGLMKRVDTIMSTLEKNIMSAVSAGVQSEFGHSLEDCSATFKELLSKGVYEKVEKAFLPRTRSVDAAKRYLEKVPPLSTKVWNGTTLAQLETATQECLMEGWGASRAATHLKQFLNEPDVYYRRFRIKTGETEEGAIYGRKWKKRVLQPDGSSKWVDDDPKKYHPGTGVYRSSYKNALRYTATTTNIAYRTADYERYQELPFVLGIEIRVSENNHTVPDICDELAGQYPVPFKWTGWHPWCRCYQVPILANEKKIEQMADAALDGKDPALIPVDGRIEDVPDKFNGWIDKNAERIKDAATLPFFLSDNGVRTDGIYTLKSFKADVVQPLTPLEIAKKRHEARTPEQIADIQNRAAERKRMLRNWDNANTILNLGREYPNVNSKLLDKLSTAITKQDWASAKPLIQEISPSIAFERRISTPNILNSTMRKLYGDDAVNALYTNTERTMDRYKGLGIDERIDKYNFEAKWARDHKKYATWEEAAEIYEREARRLEEQVRFNDALSRATEIESLLANWSPRKVVDRKITIYDTKLIEYRINQLEKLTTAIQTVRGDVEYAMATDSKVLKHYAKLLKKGFEKKGDAYSYAWTHKELKKKIDIYKRWQRHGGNAQSAGYTQETIEELKKRMGSRTPKTLEHLDEAIKHYRGSNADFVAHRDEIEKVMRQLFEDNDLGMDISGNLLESVFQNGFYNTFQSGSSDGYCGSHSMTGPISTSHSRLACAHRLFGLGKDLAKDQLPRAAYEKYGHLLDRDMLDAWQFNRTHYGKSGGNQVQVRFKRERVNCTWTFDDSLGKIFQPSLVTDPKVESFDQMLPFAMRPQSTDPKMLWEWQNKKRTSYIELQYHGDLTIDDVDSIVFGKSPELVIKKDLIAKLQAKGIKLYYYDGSSIVEY